MAMMRVLVRPPSDSCSSRVSLLSLPPPRPSTLEWRRAPPAAVPHLEGGNGGPRTAQELRGVGGRRVWRGIVWREPVGDMGLVVDEGRDNAAQGKKRLVDLPGFLLAFALCP